MGPAHRARDDLGLNPSPKEVQGIETFGALIDLHDSDMKEVGKTFGRSKRLSLEMLKDRLGKVRLADLTRERLIAFGKMSNAIQK